MKTTLNRRFLLAVVLCWVPAHAATISYTDSGTFTTSTPTTAFTAPGEPWAFTFEAYTNPSILSFGNGGFNFEFWGFNYTLNSLPAGITPSFIRFFSGANGGGFLICFNGTTTASCTDGLGSPLFGQPQMYTGTTAAPTLIPGTFSITSFAAVVNSTVFDQPNTTVLATVAIPEPSTLLTLAAGLLVLGGRRLHRTERRSQSSRNKTAVRAY
jgi:hypothetical protein